MERIRFARQIPIFGTTITPAAAAENIVTIFTQTLTSDDNGYTGYSLRNGVVITGGAGDTSQIRVTFEASSTGSMALDHASIAISSQASLASVGWEDATSTPVELTFDTGGHGFTSIASSATKVSDWVTLGGFTSSNCLLVTLDFGGSNANPRRLTGLGANAKVGFEAAAANYSDQNATLGELASQVLGINKIEVK